MILNEDSKEAIKVLFVDDEEKIVEQAKQFLEEADESLDVKTVTSVDKALEMLEKEEYDAIVSDYQMPGRDGLEFLKTMREEKRSDIPFIILTGKGHEEVAMEALNLAANRYARKGMDPRDQYRVLANAIFKEVEHRRVEKRFEKSERKYRKLIESSPDAIFLIEASSGKIIDVNKKAMDIMKISKEELVGMNHSDLYPEEDAERFEELFERYVPANNEMREMSMSIDDFYLVSGEDEYIPVELSSSVIEIDGKKVVQDIYKIVMERKLWEDTFDSIPDIFTLISPNHEILKINETGCERLGKDKTDIIGKKCYKIFHNQDKPIEECPCNEALKTRKPAEVEFVKDGRQYIATASPVFSKNGEIIVFSHTLKDVTEKDISEK